MRPRFSRKGEAPTPDEVALIAAAANDPNNVWALIAARIGPAALCVVLDEIGGEKIHVPTREHFIRALWVPVRDLMVRDLIARGVSVRAAAAALGVKKSTASRASHASHGKDDAGQ